MGSTENRPSTIKNKRPNDLVYTNMYPNYATPAQLYGATPPAAGYSYAQYLNDVVQIARPDILMYDHYPFLSDAQTTTSSGFFENLMQVRNKALENDLPYWAFLQSWESTASGYRLPSSSDVRMQAFSHATAGYTGLAYFTFDHLTNRTLLDASGNPTALYPKVAALNEEIENLGQALRFMTSDDVKFVQGSRIKNGISVANDVPRGLDRWTATNDSDEHIQSISIGNFGAEQNGLLGCFTDDNGDDAFMIMNLNHDDNIESTSSATAFTIRFDLAITELLRLDRRTGQQVTVPLAKMLTYNELAISIPAGTAELFKYHGSLLGGDFIVPEPSATALLGVTVALACGGFGRKRRCKTIRC